MKSDKTYSIKEIYLTLQGEGAQAGRLSIFTRFTGCNLWSGREEDRHKAICKFCDTDFLGTDGEHGGKYSIDRLIAKMEELWPLNQGFKYIVFTGGEPALQLDQELVNSLHTKGFEIAIETNGTKPLPNGIDWICVSPKANTELVITSGNELKLVYPQHSYPPSLFSSMSFDHFYLQPMDGPDVDDNTLAAISYCQENPQWKLSIQTHKLLGIK